MTDEKLPMIVTEYKKEAAGSVIESKFIKVVGENLKECKKIHDQIRSGGEK